MLLTDVHQHKRNLDELFNKLVNNKSRIAVSATCQESLPPWVLCVPHSPRSSPAPGSPQPASSPSLLPSLGEQTGLILCPVP